MSNIEKNLLYGLKSKKKIYSLLFLDRGKKFVPEYKIYCMKEGKRLIEEPIGETKWLQKRIAKFINQIDLPQYLFSSKKGLSNIDNAKYHVNNDYVFTLDLSKFFQKCSSDYVLKFFKNKLKMSYDNAKLLTLISTINLKEFELNEEVENLIKKSNEKLKYPIIYSHLPTGSSISQKLAFLSYRDMFDEIENLCKKNNILMSVYVDDIALSSNKKIKRDLINHITYIISKYGHEINKSKIKMYAANSAKCITGIYIDKNKKISAPSKHHFEIINLHKKIQSNENKDLNISKIKGKINYVHLIEKDKFPELRNNYKKNNKI